jgi:hypothetical protein
MSWVALARPPYTARSIKATALLEETKALLRAWTPGETSAVLLRRAREESFLGKVTASRSDDVVANAFSQRFLMGARPAGPHLKRLLESRPPGQWLTDLCLLYAARADVVLRRRSRSTPPSGGRRTGPMSIPEA